MPCYAPLTAYYAADVNPSGKRSLVFKPEASFSGVPVKLPCGRCIGCRLERSRQWALRCWHETRSHASSRFVTLTYEEDNLPLHGQLDKRHMQLFMKRLRFAYGDKRIRFFGCGEYGSRSQRPHYHLLLFGARFEDERSIGSNERGEGLFRSSILERLWPLGNNVIGDVTFDSAAYVARYVVDKIDGPMAEDHYRKVLPCGSAVQMAPEFVLMSRRPGIGVDFFVKHGREVYAHDSCVINGKEVRPPRAYDVRLAASSPGYVDALKRERRAAIDLVENTPVRRRVREQVVKVNLARFARDV
jgi:hypothetical protein